MDEYERQEMFRLKDRAPGDVEEAPFKDCDSDVQAAQVMSYVLPWIIIIVVAIAIARAVIGF